MLFEPTPIETSRSGRLRALVTVTIPVALLIAVVGFAMAGPHDLDPVTAAGALATSSPELSISPARPDATPDVPAQVAYVGQRANAVSFPHRVYDLATTSVAEALDARLRRASGTDLVAIHGWLTVRPDGSRCAPTSGPPLLAADLCWIDGIMRDDPAPALLWEDGQIRRSVPNAVHLHPQVPPGVSLWGIDTNDTASSGDGLARGPIRPVPVVLIGRFGDPRVPDCTPSARHCGESFVVERVVWTDGRWRSRPLIQALDPIRAGLDATESRQIAFQTIPGQTIVLSQALLPASMLDRLDPAAATSTAATSPTGRSADRLWYLRVMTPAPDESGPARSVRWIAIDDATGAILGTDPAS